jgi:predicted AAA+ superfamily ATPase
MQLCALRTGTTINFTDIATNCGITTGTAKAWLTLFETSFILFQLPSYHTNLGKRITKSPKLYFYDVGLAATLMGIGQETMAQKRTLYGALFENMVIVDLIKQLNALKRHYVLTFFRDSNKNEIDLILEIDGKVTPIEIKASETMNTSFFDTITWFKKQIQSEQPGIVVYGGTQNQQRSQGQVISWKDLDAYSAIF